MVIPKNNSSLETQTTHLGFEQKEDPGSILVCPGQDSHRSITGTAGLIFKGLGFPAGIISSCFPQQDTGQTMSDGCYPSMPRLQRLETPGAVWLLRSLKFLYISSSLGVRERKKTHTALLEHTLNVKEREMRQGQKLSQHSKSRKKKGIFFAVGTLHVKQSSDVIRYREDL